MVDLDVGRREKSQQFSNNSIELCTELRKRVWGGKLPVIFTVITEILALD